MLPPKCSRISCFYLAREEFDVIPVTVEHGIRAGLLPGPHKDPFDCMLIAQALAENVPLVSNDRALDGYGVKRLW
jgi:PIN domain nuclease of toxin-antitoxin system